jgi:hypothetical protein
MNEFKVKTEKEELGADINRAIEKATRIKATEISHSFFKELYRKAPRITAGLSATNERWKAEVKMVLERADAVLIELMYKIDHRKGETLVFYEAKGRKEELAGKTTWTMEFDVGYAYLRFDGNGWAALPYAFSGSSSGDRTMVDMLFNSSRGLVYGYERKTKTILHDVTNKKILRTLDGFDYKQLVKTEKGLFGEEAKYHGWIPLVAQTP